MGLVKNTNGNWVYGEKIEVNLNTLYQGMPQKLQFKQLCIPFENNIVTDSEGVIISGGTVPVLCFEIRKVYVSPDGSENVRFTKIRHFTDANKRDVKDEQGNVLTELYLENEITGYNDVPKEDYNELDWCNRDLLDYYLVSAEVNCILNADPLVEFETSTLYLTHSPSVYSIKTMAAAGIKKIIYDHCCGDIVLVRNICNYFMIEIIKFRPKDKVLIGSSTF